MFKYSKNELEFYKRKTKSLIPVCLLQRYPQVNVFVQDIFIHSLCDKQYG